MQKRLAINLAYFALAIAGVIILRGAWIETRQVSPLPYSEFRTLLRAGKVAEVVVSAGELRGVLKEPHDGRSRFVTTRVEKDVAELLWEAVDVSSQ